MRTVLLLIISFLFFVNIFSQAGMLDGTGYAPDINVTDINGNSHSLYNYLDSGKVVVLELMSVTCGHCITHASGTENSYLTNGPSGTDIARFIGLETNVSTNDSAIAHFATTHGATFPIVNNISPVTINYQLYYTPSYYVIYPDRTCCILCHSTECIDNREFIRCSNY